MGNAADQGAGRAPDPLLGRIISDRYEVLSLLAKGGMGRVYRAEQQPLGRQVALKILAVNDATDDPDFRRRFLLEASICARLKHPNTVTIFDYGRTDDDVYYIAMELLEGLSLRHAIHQQAPFEPGRAVHIALQIARSLREAHGLGVIHRDLKPGNIFLVQNDEDPDYVKVLDFGLVKVVKGPDQDLTLTGQFMGSPKYMPPEQIRGQPVDARSDIYALGAILYEMACGRPPFERPAPMDVLLAHLNEPLPSMAEIAPDAPEVPFLEEVARRCLEKAPMNRYASMEELIAALRTAAAAAEVALPEGSSTSRSLSTAAVERVMASMAPLDDSLEISAIDTGPPIKERRKTALILGLVLVAVAALGAAAAWVVGQRAEHPPGPARPAPPVVAPTPAPTPDEPSGVPVLGLLSLGSRPEGARVKLGEAVLCEATPCAEVRLPGSPAPGSELRLGFELEGWRGVELPLEVLAGPMSLEAELEALPRKPRKPRRPKRPEKPAGEERPPEGYKDDPY
ncbi:MAG: serine/threonine-protein kinase [Deltaproteobacteria bacterium]|nr:serine/threonine-protein kinase [Deltaproteobacteria bacterium]